MHHFHALFHSFVGFLSVDVLIHCTNLKLLFHPSLFNTTAAIKPFIKHQQAASSLQDSMVISIWKSFIHPLCVYPFIFIPSIHNFSNHGLFIIKNLPLSVASIHLPSIIFTFLSLLSSSFIKKNPFFFISSSFLYSFHLFFPHPSFIFSHHSSIFPPSTSLLPSCRVDQRQWYKSSHHLKEPLYCLSLLPPIRCGGGVVCGVVWCSVVWCGVVWCGMVWCGVVWCGVVWCGVVWCGVVWCGVVWCGVVWCGGVW